MNDHKEPLYPQHAEHEKLTTEDVLRIATQVVVVERAELLRRCAR